MYSFERTVHVVSKTHLTFTSNLTQRGVTARKPKVHYFLENLSFRVIPEKILDVWKTRTHKGKGLKTKKCDFFKIQEFSYIIDTEILHFGQLEAKKIEFEVL